MGKRYIGSISDERRAAEIYDKYAILAHGLAAKTNFNYSKKSILKLMDTFEENDDATPARLGSKLPSLKVESLDEEEPLKLEASIP